MNQGALRGLLTEETRAHLGQTFRAMLQCHQFLKGADTVAAVSEIPNEAISGGLSTTQAAELCPAIDRAVRGILGKLGPDGFVFQPLRASLVSRRRLASGRQMKP